MNLSDFFPIPASMPVLDAFGEPTGTTFQITAMDLAGASQKANRKAGLYIISNKADPDPEVIHNLECEMIAGSIVGWSGLYDGDQEVPYSPEKALELISHPGFAYVRAQVEKFASQRANFFRKAGQ